MADSPLTTWLRDREPSARAEALLAGAPPAQPWDLDDPPPEPRPRWRLLMLAAVPWAVALALGVALLGGAREEAVMPEPVVGPVAATEDGAVDGAVAETGALLVRAALSGSGQGAPRYVDAAVATGVEMVGDASVVSVLALVLEGGGQGWERAGLERYAVALRMGEPGPALLGGPWALPPPAEGPPSAEGAAVSDPALHELVAAELAAVGYRDVTGLDLRRDPARPGVLLARLEAIPPGGESPGTWTAWLRDEPSPVLIGTNR